MQQTDVKAAIATATGSVYAARARIKSIYYVGGAIAGSIVLTDGNGGATMLSVATPASGYGNIFIPGEGIQCNTGIYIGTLTNITSLTIFYG